MTTRIGINGFGRMGRLALRAAWGRPEFEFALVNEPECGAEVGAHLLTFDSVQRPPEPRSRGEYFAAGVKKVIVAAPVKEEALNVVVGARR